MSIDNYAIVNNSCDNISHIYNSVNSAISEYMMMYKFSRIKI